MKCGSRAWPDKGGVEALLKDHFQFKYNTARRYGWSSPMRMSH